MSGETPRYTAVAIVLHWAIAIAILSMIPFGWWMADAIKVPATQAHAVAAFQLHKSIGLSILVLSLVRLGWRLTHRPPPLPSGMATWERLAAQATHIGFYVIMIAMPLSGWAYVSTGFTTDGHPLNIPTFFFGLFEVPHLPIANASEEVRRNAAQLTMSAHSAMAWGALALAALHVGAALKHHLLNKDGVLARMVPGLPEQVQTAPAAPARSLALSIGLGAVVLAFVALAITALTPPVSKPAAPLVAEAAAPTPAPTPGAPASVEPINAATPPPPITAQPTATPAAANSVSTWLVDTSASSIGFAGTHTTSAFSGQFTQWRADIRFGPDALANSSVDVRIQTGSAQVDNRQYTATLREAEWFGPDQFPEARFRANRFRAISGDRYEAIGTLQIKGQEIPITLPFRLQITGNTATMSATVNLDRVANGLGLSSDPDADWVSRQIAVTINVRATRQP
jgi:cytochrome b561/polyisoprenoid-binding protein YceI